MLKQTFGSHRHSVISAMSFTTWLVTGANRGMGLEWVTQVLALEHTTVIAAGRPTDDFQELEQLQKLHANRLTIVKIELLQLDTIEAAADNIQQLCPDGIDYLINNAGILGGYPSVEEQTIQEFTEVLLTNVVGTFSVTKSFLPLLKAGHKKVIVHISSNAASLSRNERGLKQDGLTDASLALSYRASKVAVNMQTTVLANDLKHKGFTVVSLDPGDVSTGMWRYLTEEVFTESSPFAKRQPSLTPQESVNAMLKLTLELNVEQTGKFILYDGTNLPW